MAGRTRLTSLEASFLALEHPGLPMHVAGVVLFDASQRAGGMVTLKDLRLHVASRLRRLPRFRQRVSYGLFGLTRPEWTRVSRLDLRSHLFHHQLPAPGHQWQLTNLCGRIHAEPLPRDRPLWQVHLIDGLENGRQALVVKTHHAITDGIAGIQVAEVLFDRESPHSRWVNGGLPPLQFAHHAPPSAMGLAQAMLGLAFTVAGGPLALAGPFNGPVGAHRAFAMATIPMESIRRLKRRLGGSVDDIVLAVAAAGLSRRLARARYPDMPGALRAMLPVSTWPPAYGAPLGNHVTAVFVDLPLDSSDIPALVRRIAASKSMLRSTHAAAGMSLLIEAAGRLPHPLHEAVVRFAGALPTSNLVLSDVPGPDDPLFFLGRRVLACYPMIPLPPNVGLSLASVSIGGQMGVGIVADPDLVPSPHRLAAEIEAAVRTFERSQLPRPSRRPQLTHPRAA